MEASTGKEQITVLIVDDHPIVREGLRSTLNGKEVRVLGEAANGAEAIERVRELRPDIVLMDVRMPDMDGLTATEMIKKEQPETAIIVVTSYESIDYLKRAILAGAAGYVLKDFSRTALVDAIRVVMSGGSLIDGVLLRGLLKEVGLERRGPTNLGGLEALSPREREVLQLLVQGLTNKEIAREMQYSVATVKSTVQRIIDKLGVSDRTQAAVLAVQAGMRAEQSYTTTT